MQSSWKAPRATYTKEQFKKVMVVVLFKDETFRRIAEDKITVKNIAFRASYMVLGKDQQNMDEASFTAFVKKEGYDAVLALHLVDVQHYFIRTGWISMRLLWLVWGELGWLLSVRILHGRSKLHC